MKKVFFLLLLLVSVQGFSQTYYWITNSAATPIADYRDRANWSTTGSSGAAIGATGVNISLSATVNLIFDGTGSMGTSNVVANFLSSNTIGTLQVIGGANATFQRAASTSTLTVNGDGTSADDFIVSTGSTLKILSGGGGVLVVLGVASTASSTGLVSGSVNITGTASSRLAVLNGSIIFANGSVAYANLTGSNYPFGGSTTQSINGGVIFQPGSALVSQGSSVFGNTSTFNPLVFQPGSAIIYEAANGAGSFGSRTLANMRVRNNATVAIETGLFNIDTLTIEPGSSVTLPQTGTTPISGDILNNGNFGAVAGVTTNSLIMDGIVPQTISGLGTFNSLGSFTVATLANVTLNKPISIVGTGSSSTLGKLDLQANTISGSGPFQFRGAVTVTPTATTTSGSNSITVVSSFTSISTGMLVTGDGIQSNTFVISTNSGSSTFNISKPATASATGVTITIAGNAATAMTSHPNGLDGNITTAGTKSYGSGTNYVFNAATVIPFPAAVATLLTGNATFNADVTMNNGLSVAGTLAVNNGTLTTGINAISLNSTTGSAIFNPASTLNINDAASIVSFNFRPVVFQSSAIGTARLAPVIGTLNDATAVTVQRYIPARRAWRLMNAPLIASNSINASWQNGGVYTPGIGTHITGSGSGLDVVANSASSMKTFNTATQNLDNVTSTTINLSDNPAYFIFIRGDRAPANLAPPATNVTTLNATGALLVGPASSNVVARPTDATFTFTLVGNPYMSPINWTSLTKTATADRFILWDPKLAGSNTVGGYVVFDVSTGYKPSAGGGSYTTNVANTIIESSQAFFVESSVTGTAGSIGFAEGNKVASNQNVFRQGNGTAEKLNVVLKVQQSDNSFASADGVFAVYDNVYSTAVTPEDAGKLNNLSENLSIIRNGSRLTIEKRPLIDVSDTIFLRLESTIAKNYQFEVNPSDFSAPTLGAYLEDAFTKTSLPLSLTSITLIDFAVTDDAASSASDRFRIVFRTNSALPINYTLVKAYQKNAGVQVDWSIASEHNASGYEIEKSTNGRSFVNAGYVQAKANNNPLANYNWFDATPANGNNYYRIKAIDNSSLIKYSQVVAVKISTEKSEISVYPNPVTGSTFSLQFNNLEKGSYAIKLFNKLGQEVYSKTIAYAGGSSTETLSIPALLSKGVYQLQIAGETTKTTKQIVVR